MNSRFKQYNVSGAFELDINKIVKSNNCKGLLSMKVFPANKLDTLRVNGISSDLASYNNPFDITSPNAPIISGRISFKPTKNIKMKSVVRLILST